MTSFVRVIVRACLALGGAAILLILVTQVVLRYVFQWPIFGAEELARIIAMWVYFIAGAYALAVNQHICADIRGLISMPAMLTKVLDIIVHTAITLASILLAWLCFDYAWWVYESKELTPGLWWPRYILVSASAVGNIALSCIAFLQLVRQVYLSISNKGEAL